MTKNALQSLWGEGHADASRTNKARDAFAMPGVRKQRVLTPEPFREILTKFWGGIAYDAAGEPSNNMGADAFTLTRGLFDPWPDRTWCNPPWGTSLFDPENQQAPYEEECRIREAWKAAGKRGQPKFPPGLPVPKANLGDWLRMQDSCMDRSVMLVPVRTNRTWMREWWQKQDVIIGLDPVKFVGAPTPFPGPLALSMRGEPQAASRFAKAFCLQGSVLKLR